MPTGWVASGSGAGGALAAGHYGRGWQFSGGGGISQGFYLDAYGGPIATPSYAQVVQPIYKRASGRWQRYREQMAPVLPILMPWAEKMGYEPADD